MMKGLLRGILIISLFFCVSCSQKRKTNWNVSFDRNSKDPFGCYLAYHSLAHFFPDTKIQSGRALSDEMKDALTFPHQSRNKQRLSIVVSRNVTIDSTELQMMQRYVRQGNSLCIVSENFSTNILNYFKVKADEVFPSRTQRLEGEDTIANQQITIFFNHVPHTYHYDGLPIEYGFDLEDTLSELYYYMGYGKSAQKPSSLIRFEGDGQFMIHRSPVTLSNHFLIQDDHRAYMEYFFSFFDSEPSSVTWYSGYNYERKSRQGMDLSRLMKYPPFFYAFLIIASLLLIYTLFESKRRQRPIPVLPPNTNSILEFTETVGLLYYNHKDHKNLSEKMIRHYFETIRSNYGLKTNSMDETFSRSLAHKINRKHEETHSFLMYIRYIRDSEKITETDIRHLYHQLKKFI